MRPHGRTAVAIAFAVAATACGDSFDPLGPGGGGSGGPGEPETIVVTFGSGEVAVDDELTLFATVSDENGLQLSAPDISWSSSDPTVLTVDDQGVVTGVSEGGATVTATIADLSETVGLEVRGWMLGVSGGVVQSSDGQVSVSIPEGALSEPTVITVEAAEQTPSDPSAEGYVPGSGYGLGPVGLALDLAATVVISYDESSIPQDIPESSIRLKQAVDGRWTAVAGATVDQGANTVSAEVTTFALFGAVGQEGSNEEPNAQIDEPGDGTSVDGGVIVQLDGTGSDGEDGTLIGANLVWSSDRDGLIGSGPSVLTATLSIGTHTIELEVTDSQGASDTDQVILDILNNLPTASITSPGNNAVFTAAADITFIGVGADVDDGLLTGAQLEWRSDVDGVLGTGETLVATGLSVGLHEITLEVTDSHGGVATATVDITII